MAIIAKCKHFDGTEYQQECATPDVARSCMKAFRADPTVKYAMAYYTDDRGTVDTYEAATGRQIVDEVEALQDVLRLVQYQYQAAQARFDRAVNQDVKDSNMATCAKWNRAEMAIRRAIARLNTLRS